LAKSLEFIRSIPIKEKMNDEKVRDNEMLWDERVPQHLESNWYPVDAFLSGASVLDHLESQKLGDVTSRRVLHLQCHFGLTSLSIARRGASITGLDFSQAAVTAAREIARKAELQADFVKADARNFNLNREFDLIFVSWGSLIWLPELTSWAKCIAAHLHEHGKLVLIDFHPLLSVWSPENKGNTFTIAQSYFSPPSLVSVNPPSYTGQRPLKTVAQHTWFHSLTEIFSALKGAGLQVEEFEEYPHCPLKPFREMERDAGNGYWSLAGNPFPLSFALTARNLQS
jgi:2-polyprenyl-3-methyl-5-hydroxy-6-metoxy-1,4-benzoquinol methylase